MFKSAEQRRACFWKLNNRFSVSNSAIIDGSNRLSVAMLSKLVTDPDKISAIMNDDGWIACDKYDGMRTFAVINNDRVEMFNPRHEPENYSFKFADISKDLLEKYRDRQPAILDGEVRCVVNGRDDVHAVIGMLNTDDPEKLDADQKVHPPQYVLFDIIEIDDNDVSKHPLEERLGILEDSLGKNTKNVMFGECVYEDKNDFVDNIMREEKEGVVFKDLSSGYEFGGRSGSWVKYKKHDDDTFVVYGLERGSGKNSDKMGSLLIGEYKDGMFIERGKVGTGFTDEERRRIWEKYGSQAGDKIILPEGKRFGIDVRFMETDSRGGLRHPRAEKIREDISVSDGSEMSKRYVHNDSVVKKPEHVDIMLVGNKYNVKFRGVEKDIDPSSLNHDIDSRLRKKMLDGTRLNEYDLNEVTMMSIMDAFDEE